MIAIIPARGGSKGLPGKNIRPLNGKPLIAYAVEEGLKAKHIDRVIVSTEDEEIARIAVEYGAELPFMRPAELATDTAMAVDNYIYTINRLEKEGGKPIDSFVVLQPTSPLRIAEDIDGAVDLFEQKSADSVVSYCREAHPVTWHKYLDEEGRFVNIFEDTLKNRQDNRVSYYPNGAVYVFKTTIIRERKYFTDKSYAYIMPRIRSVDIDFIEDFEYAEFLLKRR
jgi:N-acylneuraminate cytidylyltransferase/CMP-N,N'-diacetyllegionaminic acid synthase